ncbi:phosphatidylinositol-glycan biosynthesis class F protein isoform X4 [Erinaceus europaeus]|uniref:Phosphatidylinositol-glycan biosynthesis class F protein isoform X4 n=1 Tax=Erinaceus europaeus TaxID=9365 RepID=A0ABM3X3X5_ERIEU|nr:phosphatidylinositol-glycan biosynthesis class F protein isoform X4 [Erinaceus europaeus]
MPLNFPLAAHTRQTGTRATTQENTMKDTDIKRLLYTHLLCIFSIILSIFIPSLFLENFSVLETHLTWLCICSVFVTAINLILYLVVKPNTPSKRSSLSYKVTRFLKCCIYFLLSCFFFHIIFVLYGAPLIEVTSIWENSLQITTISSFLGTWFGAFPIPLDWERPWQVWPISCTLGATLGYVAGLIISPLWIYWNRKQLTYKNN